MEPGTTPSAPRICYRDMQSYLSLDGLRQGQTQEPHSPWRKGQGPPIPPGNTPGFMSRARPRLAASLPFLRQHSHGWGTDRHTAPLTSQLSSLEAVPGKRSSVIVPCHPGEGSRWGETAQVLSWPTAHPARLQEFCPKFSLEPGNLCRLNIRPPEPQAMMKANPKVSRGKYATPCNDPTWRRLWIFLLKVMPLVMKKAIYQGVTKSQLCHAVHSPGRYEVSFFLLVHWSALADHCKASEAESGLCLAHAAQDWKHGLILPLHGNVVSAGWRTGREVEEKGWYKCPCFPATMRALRDGVSLLCSAPYTCTKPSHLIFPLPTVAKRALSKTHTQYS